MSIRGTDCSLDKLSQEEVEEQKQTYFVVDNGAVSATVGAFREFFRMPSQFLRGCLGALSLAGMKPKLWPMYLIYFLEAVVAGARFRQEQVTHVHTHFASTVTLLMSRLNGFTFSITIHGPAEFDDVKGFHLADKVSEARLVVAISHYAASQIMRVAAPEHWKKIEVVRLGIAPDSLKTRSLHDHDAGKPYELLTVGRLAHVKAQLVLLNVLERLRERSIAARLTLVGEGPLRPALEKEVQARGLGELVELTGALNFEQVIHHFHNADIFVLPSFAEGVPVVLMEAMAMRLPCVSTWVNGIPELIMDGHEGLLTAPADVDGLVDRIEYLINNPEKQVQIVHSAQKKVLEKYNLSKNVQKLSETFIKYNINL
ncbi:glycosyltransferase family 4 protein [Thermodesulfobacteriota bacterium]